MRPLDLGRWAVRDRFLAKVVLRAWLFGWVQILFGKRYRLWNPVPGIATHLDASALAPTIDWEGLIREEGAALRPQSPSVPGGPPK